MQNLRAVFDPRANSLNVIRLLLAVGVILIHTLEVTGREVGSWPVRQFLEAVWVDGFFVISGFLIYRSWMQRPSIGVFVRSRASRILPGFYICLIVTAFVLAPVGAALAGGDPIEVLLSGSALTYILANAGIYMFQTGIAGTPAGVPFEGYWNVSLWTLAWEVACYAAVLITGWVGLLRRAWALPAFTAATWLLSLSGALNLHNIAPVNQAGRFFLMFLVGAMFYRYAARIPAAWWTVAASAVIVGLSMALPDYRLVGAPFLAHILLVAGSRLNHPRIQLRNDYSYGTYIYGFPIQQLMVLGGLATIPTPAFMVLSVALTAPLAYMSWHYVEKPVTKWAKPGPVQGRALTVT